MVPAAKMPWLLIVPPPATTFQVGVTLTLLFLSSRPSTEKATVAEGLSLAEVGVITRWCSAPDLITTEALPVAEPDVAVTASG